MDIVLFRIVFHYIVMRCIILNEECEDRHGTVRLDSDDIK